MYKKEYQDGGMMQAGPEMSEGAEQLQMLKAAYDKAVEEENMEMIGEIESVIKEMFDSIQDPKAREALSMMFPDMDFMVDEPAEMKREAQERPSMQQMMAQGGYMKEKEKYPGGGYFMMK
jgi:hypothetical protein